MPTMEYSARTAENRAALSIAKSLKGPNNKYINSVYNAVQNNITNSAPSITCLNAVAQGTSENTRVGRLAKMNWLDIDFDLYTVNTTGQNIAKVRAYIVVETTALGSNISPGQFFVDNAVFNHLSQRDRTNRNASRFVVLYDSGPHVLASQSSAGSGTTNSMAAEPTSYNKSLHIPLGFSTDYSRGNAGTVADIDTNALYLLVVTDNATSNQTYVNAAFTVCFSDDK